MISKSYIKSLDFETLEDVFNYVVDSEINGAYAQCKELINRMSLVQFNDFVSFLYSVGFNDRENEKFIKKAVAWRIG